MSYSIMHGKHIHFQKSDLFTCGRSYCPADDCGAPGGRTLCPVEAVVFGLELDPGKRATQGHDLPWTPAQPGTTGRYPSAPKEKGPFKESFPAPKFSGKDRDRRKYRLSFVDYVALRGKYQVFRKEE
jgi:hypothetical protein